MFADPFTPEQRGLIAATVLLAIVAAVQQWKSRPRLAILLLTLAAFLLRLLAAFLDPFLNDWDEVFHAVVAKNMMTDPLTPMLYKETAMPLTSSWSQQHFWLHKPPFFLWQIALSLKLFGLQVWAVRIPSVLWMTALVPVIWRLGNLLRDERTGFVAAFLAAFAFLPQELTSGALNTDHNDAVFIAVVACSWWTWLEFVRSPHWKWALLTGLFAACAVLTKWYIGACVFLPWGLWVLQGKFAWARLKGLLLAASVMLLPVLAWVLHITNWFPAEAAYEWTFKARHFADPIDGHRGTWTYHFDIIGKVIPPLTLWVLLPALAWLFWRTGRAAERIFIASLVIAIHAFFMVAQTKMLCYTMVLFPLYVIAMGHAIVSIAEQLPWKNVRVPATMAASIVLASFMFGYDRVSARHSTEVTEKGDPKWRRQNIEVMRDLPRLQRFVSQEAKAVLFNMHQNHHLRFMFSTGIETWAWPPSPEDVARLNAKGYTVFVLQDGADPSTMPVNTRMVPDSVFAISREVRL
ncbi:MAG: glycosyltransferase family 39 protein [Flavobacteriales bacterium]|nr:glycosyltransferase family 39 protein [Flavobacteriales bacterium]